MKIKQYFPDAGQKLIVSKNGCGYRARTLQSQYDFGNHFVHDLITNKELLADLTADLFEDVLLETMNIRTRGRNQRALYLYGVGAEPPSWSLPAIYSIVVARLLDNQTHAMDLTRAPTAAMLIIKLLATAGLINVTKSSDHLTLRKENAFIPDFFTRTNVRDDLISMVVIHRVRTHLKTIFQNLASEKGLSDITDYDGKTVVNKGFRVIPSLAMVFANITSRLYNHIVRVERAAIMGLTSLYRIYSSFILANNEPDGRVENVLSYWLVYANFFFAARKIHLSTVSPSSADFANAEKLRADFEAALADSDSRYEVVATSTFVRRAFTILSTKILGDHAIQEGDLLKWATPASLTYAALSVTDWAQNGQARMLSTVSGTESALDWLSTLYKKLGDATEQMVSGIPTMRQGAGHYVDDQTSANTTILPYSIEMVEKLKIALAVAIIDEFEVHDGDIQYFMHSIAYIGSSAQYTDNLWTTTSNPADVIAALAHTMRGRGDTLIKHPLISSVLPKDQCVVQNFRLADFDAIPISTRDQYGIRDLHFMTPPRVIINISNMDGDRVSLSVPVTTLLGLANISHDVYFFPSVDNAVGATALANALAVVNSGPENPGCAQTERKIYFIVRSIALDKFGHFATQYTLSSSRPVSYSTVVNEVEKYDAATRLIIIQNAINILLALLAYLNVGFTAQLTTLLQHAISTLSDVEQIEG